MHINMFPRTPPAGAWKPYMINISSFTPSRSAASLSYHSKIERHISMEGEKQVYQETASKKNFGSCDPRHVQWVIMEAENDTIGDYESIESIGDDSGNNSAASASSSDLAEDASSSSSPSYGPLYELSELMNQLPIKRGLSKYYQGKSQSFTSLANVNSLEDLAKKVSPYSRRMKSCKSYAGSGGHKFGPKAVIVKKSSRGSSFYLH